MSDFFMSFILKIDEGQMRSEINEAQLILAIL